MKVTTCTTAILADVLLLRYMYISMLHHCLSNKITKVVLDRIIVYTLYKILS